MLNPVGINVCHWEGPGLWGPLWAFGHDACAGKVRTIQNFHMNGAYSDIAYNDVACPHGYVFEGRGLGVANGASGTTAANTHRYAVCALVGQGDGIANMPELFDALNAALTGYCLFGGAHSSPASGHRDVVATACPGDIIDAWADRWSLGIPIPAPPAPGPAPAPGPGVDWHAIRVAIARKVEGEVAVGPLLRLGSRGGEVTSWQHALNLTVGANLAPDGDFGRLTRTATGGFQYVASIGVDGVVGPQSRGAMVTALKKIA